MSATSSATDRPSRPRTRARGVVAVLASGAVALLVGACGGSGSHGVANLGRSHHSSANSKPSYSGSPVSSAGGGSSSASGHNFFMKPVGAVSAVTVRQDFVFAACMRANGVPGFPNPNSQGAFLSANPDFDPNSPQFQKAQVKCFKESPDHHTPAEAHAELVHLVAYAQCIRSHDVPDFPDPTTGPGTDVTFSLHWTPGSDLDPNSPILQRAEKACRNLPGALPSGP